MPGFSRQSLLQSMIFEHIETIKRQFTDKYVVVDESQPELQRFRGLTGMVKTVNMSGRALVEFDGYNNIGWYDIDPTFLKVVDAPPPKPRSEERRVGKQSRYGVMGDGDRKQLR